MRLCLCTACRRQLNVSALAPGDVVRCVCGALLTVGAAPDLVVEGLVCGHCGAPVGREDGRCAHCLAGLSERDRIASLLCPSCGTRLPEDSRHCKACGVALRPQAITALRDGAACPACRGQLVVRLTDDFDVVECAVCSGVWVTMETLRHLAGRAAQSEAFALGMYSAPPSAPAQRGYVPCVTCGELMMRRQYHHQDRPSGVIIDQCKDHGVWFDSGELAQALRFVRDVAAGQERRASISGPKRVTRAPRRRARSSGGQGGASWGLAFGELLADLLLMGLLP